MYIWFVKYLILILLLGLMAACKNASDTPALSDEEMLRLLLEKMEREAQAYWLHQKTM